jgi:RNA polymerase sigma factor (sigma-70 family)
MRASTPDMPARQPAPESPATAGTCVNWGALCTQAVGIMRLHALHFGADDECAHESAMAGLQRLIHFVQEHTFGAFGFQPGAVIDLTVTSEPAARLYSWLVTVVERLVTDSVRRRKLVSIEYNEDTVESTPSPFKNPEEQSLEAESRESIRTAVTRLSRSEAKLLIHKFYYGHSCKEIAGVYHITERACQRRLERALAHLRLEYLSLTEGPSSHRRGNHRPAGSGPAEKLRDVPWTDARGNRRAKAAGTPAGLSVASTDCRALMTGPEPTRRNRKVGRPRTRRRKTSGRRSRRSSENSSSHGRAPTRPGGITWSSSCASRSTAKGPNR